MMIERRCDQTMDQILAGDGPYRVLPGPPWKPHLAGSQSASENDDIGPVAIVFGSAVIALGTLTVIGVGVSMCVALLRKLVCRCPR